MAITFINSWTGTTSAGTSAVASEVGDIFIAFAFRDGSTFIPLIASAWKSATTLSGTSCSAIVAYKFASGTTTDITQLFSNATSTIILQYRCDTAVQVITDSTINSGTTSTVTYPSLSGYSGVSDRRIMFAGHRSTNTAIETAPVNSSGEVGGGATLTRVAWLQDTVDEVVAYDIGMPGANPIADLAAYTDAAGGTASGWITSSLVLTERESNYTSSELSDTLTSPFLWEAVENGQYSYGANGLTLLPTGAANIASPVVWDSAFITYDLSASTTGTLKYIIKDHTGRSIQLRIESNGEGYVEYFDFRDVIQSTSGVITLGSSGTFSLAYDSGNAYLGLATEGGDGTFTSLYETPVTFDPSYCVYSIVFTSSTSTDTAVLSNFNTNASVLILAEEATFDWIDIGSWSAEWTYENFADNVLLEADALSVSLGTTYPYFSLTSLEYEWNDSHMTIKTPEFSGTGSSLSYLQFATYYSALDMALLIVTVTSDGGLFYSVTNGYEDAFDPSAEGVTDITPAGGLPAYLGISFSNGILYCYVSDDGNSWEAAAMVEGGEQLPPLSVSFYGGFVDYDGTSTSTVKLYNLNEETLIVPEPPEPIVATLVTTQSGIVDGESPGEAITINTTPTAGNLLVLFVGVDKTVEGNEITATGFTRIAQHNTGPNVSGALFYRIATGDETSTTIDWVVGTPSSGSYMISEFSAPYGWHDSLVDGVTNTINTATSRVAETDSLTAVNDTLAIGVFTNDSGGSLRNYTNIFVPNGFDLVSSIGSESSGIGYPAIFMYQNPAAEGSLNFRFEYTGGSTDENMAFLALFRMKAEDVSLPSPIYLKIWNGTEWIIPTVKIWNGTEWMVHYLKLWDGAVWRSTVVVDNLLFEDGSIQTFEDGSSKIQEGN